MTILDQPTFIAMQRAVLDALETAPLEYRRAAARAMLDLANDAQPDIQPRPDTEAARTGAFQ